MAPNGRVSRGNTSDLVGLWNKLATTDTDQAVRSRSRSPISGNLTAHNQFKFRKTSAYEPSTTSSPSSLSPDVARVESPHFRKTSALVLMPTYPKPTLSIDTTDAVTGGEAGYRPRKTSAMSSLSVQVGFPLKSALKNSTGNLQQENSGPIPTVVTSPPPDAKHLNPDHNSGRRGSGLGRSKSVKCNRVKFGALIEEQGAPASPRLLNHGSGKPEEKKLSPFDKFRNMENKNSSQDYIAPGRLTRQASLPSVSAPRSAPPPTDVNQNQTETVAGPKKSIMSRSPSSAKELLLMWAQQRTNTYPNLNVTNFSTSWNDGLAFCALIHYYYPEAFDFEKLDPKNRRENFTLAFKMAEDYAGICPLLDVEDMVMMIKPDWKCVFTYVQSFYRRFRNGRDPPPPTRILSLQPEESQVSKNQEKVLSPEKQKSLLSKYLLDDDDKDRDRDKKKASSSSLRSTQSRAPLTSTLSSPAVSAGSLEKNITGIKSANLESSLLSKIDEKDETKQAVEKKLASISFADTNQSSSSETSSETVNKSTTSLSTTNTAGDGSNIKTNADPECDQNDNLSSPDFLDKDNNNVSSVPVTPPPSASQDLSKPQMPSQPPPNLPAAS